MKGMYIKQRVLDKLGGIKYALKVQAEIGEISRITSTRMPGSGEGIVACINQADAGGGGIQQAATLSHGLTQFGWNYHFFVHENLNVETHVKAFPDVSEKELVFDQKLALQSMGFSKLAFLKSQPDFISADLVHLHNIHSKVMSYLDIVALSKMKPIIWTLHDMHAFTGHCAHSFECDRWKSGCGKCPDLQTYPAIKKDTTAWAWKTKMCVYNHAAKMQLVVPSQWLANKVAQSPMGNMHPVKVIYNGGNSAVFFPRSKSEMRKKLNLPEDRPIVVMAAHKLFSNPFKGGALTKEILTAAKEKNWLFVALGAEPNGEVERQFPNLMPIPFVIDQNKVAEYFAASDLLLFPSLAENCPLAVIDAQLTGLPVVGTNVGGIPEIVIDGKTAFLNSPQNVNDIFLAMENLLEEQTRLKEAAGEAFRNASEKFTSEIMVDSYNQLFNEVLNTEESILAL